MKNIESFKFVLFFIYLHYIWKNFLKCLLEYFQIFFIYIFIYLLLFIIIFYIFYIYKIINIDYYIVLLCNVIMISIVSIKRNYKIYMYSKNDERLYIIMISNFFIKLILLRIYNQI